MSYSKAKNAFKRTLSVAVSVTTTLWLLAPAFVGGVVPTAQAAVVTSTSQIVDGDTIRASGDIDVYIVKLINGKMYKRLVLNPQVFNSYGHLKWENVKEVSQTVLNSYMTSDVVRMDGDSMVFRLIPDGDTGTKAWIGTAEVFLGLGYDWDQIYTINSVDGGNYTTGTPITSTDGSPTPAPSNGTGLTVTNVALNSSAVPRGATGVEMVRFTVAAGEVANITNFSVTRKGIGSTNDFSRVHLYENGARVGSSRTFSSETNKAEFSNLNLAFTAGQIRTFSIMADYAIAAGAGNINFLEVSMITADKTVTGTPVAGPVFAIGSAAVGILTVTNNGSLTNPRIGDTSAVLANFSLTPATEHATLKKIVLRQTGSALLSNITNWGLYASGTKIADGTVNGVYVSFMPTSHTLSNGTQRSYEVKGDISGANRPNDTVALSLENGSDLIATGSDFGVNMFVDTNGDNTYVTNEYQDGTVTIQGGRLTFTFNGPTASDVALNSQDVVVMEFTLTSTVSGYIDTLSLDVLADDDGDNDPFDEVADGVDDEGLIRGANVEQNLKDIKIRRKSSGTTVWGPQELTLAGNDALQTLTFNEDFTLTSGLSEVFQVTMDTDNNMPSGIEFGARLNAVTAYDSNNNTIAAADIVPTTLSTVRSNVMTTNSASLTVAMATTPTSQTVVGGGWVDAAGFVFTAGASSPITITSITFTGFGDDDTVVGGATAAEFDDVVGSVRLMMGGTQLGTDESPSAAGAFTFDGFNHTIPAGQSQTLIVRALPDTTLLSSDADQFFIDLQSTAANTTTNVNAVDKDGNTVNATNNGGDWGGAAAQLNDDDGTSIAVTVNASGTLQVQLAGTPVDAQLMTAGTTGNDVTKVRFDTLNEPFNVTVLTVAILDAAGFDAVQSISVYNGATLVGGAAFSPDSNGRVRLSNDAGLFTVTPGTSTNLTLKADVAAHGSNNQGTDSGDEIRLGLWVDDNDTFDNFKAVGVNSSTALRDEGGIPAGLTFVDNTGNSDADATTTVIAGNTMIARVAKPTVTISGGTTGSLVGGSNTLLSFTVTPSPSGKSITMKRILLSFNETDTGANMNWNSLVLKRGSTSLNTNITITDQAGANLTDAAGNELSDGDTIIITWTGTLEEEVSAATTYSLEATVTGTIDSGDSGTTRLINDTVETGPGNHGFVSYIGSDGYATAGVDDVFFWDFGGTTGTFQAANDVQVDIADAFTGATGNILTGGFIFNDPAAGVDNDSQLFIDTNGNGVYDAGPDLLMDVHDDEVANMTALNGPVRWEMWFNDPNAAVDNDEVVFFDVNANGVYNVGTDIRIVTSAADYGVDATGLNGLRIATDGNFIWSDRAADIHSVTTQDFINGFLLNAPSGDADDVQKVLVKQS